MRALFCSQCWRLDLRLPARPASHPRTIEAGPLSEEDLAAIEASLESFAQVIRASDWAALAALYTEDAVFMAPE